MTTEAGGAVAPIERDEAYDRDYIPLPGGWEVQTKGRGSTFRIAEPDDSRLAIPDSPYLHETLTKMARDIHAAYAAERAARESAEAALAAMWAQCEGLAKDAARYRWLRDGRNLDGPQMVGELAADQLDAAIDRALASGSAGGEAT